MYYQSYVSMLEIVHHLQAIIQAHETGPPVLILELVADMRRESESTHTTLTLHGEADPREVSAITLEGETCCILPANDLCWAIEKTNELGYLELSIARALASDDRLHITMHATTSRSQQGGSLPIALYPHSYPALASGGLSQIVTATISVRVLRQVTMAINAKKVKVFLPGDGCILFSWTCGGSGGEVVVGCQQH